MSATPPSSSSKKGSWPSTLHQRQSCQVTRAVQTMSAFNGTSMTNTFRKYFYSRKHFPKILGGVMIASGIAGYYSMGWWHTRQLEERKRIYIDAYHNRGDGHGSGDNRLVSLARKMTQRFAAASSPQSSFYRTDTSILQRQVTKFW